MALTHGLCQHSDYYFKHLLGDQECWRVAMAATGFRPHVLGPVIRAAKGKHAYLLPLDGRDPFVHRSGTKLVPLALPLEHRAAAHFAAALDPDGPPPVGGSGPARYRFVRVDCDTYRSTLAAIDRFAPLMTPGGVMVFDDFGRGHTPGVTRALRERFGDRVERAVEYQARF